MEPEAVAPAAGFTGIRVYGDPRTCNPCRLLESDLRWLAENHGWSLSEHRDIAADWQILPARGTDQRIPLIEIWRNGRISGVEYGYSSETSWQNRRDALHALVKKHPRRVESGGGGG